MRHLVGKKVSLRTWVSHRTILCDRKVFLANEKNKGALITMISAGMPVVVVAQCYNQYFDIALLSYRPIHYTHLYFQAGFDGLYDICSIDKEEFLVKDGWSGNDTVSCIHGHTKCALYKCRFPASVMTAFTSNTLTDSTIWTAGLKVMHTA